MVDVFVNYRTDDAAYPAAMCYEALRGAFGRKRVFRDCVSMRPGDLYPETIRQALEETRILLVLIGPDWFARDPDSDRRLVDREDDWVRREIRRAFVRNIPVVQVLLDGVSPVEAKDLPSDIARLAHCQAAHVSHRCFGDDVRRLVAGVTDLVPELSLPDLFPPQRDLPPDPLPSMLLQADHGVVPFQRADDELDRLTDWLAAPDHLAAHLLTGPGGQGKTRLAHEVIERAKTDGWTAGLLAEEVPAPVLDRIHEFRGPVLVVIDYAEARTEQIADVAAQLIARPVDQGPARLLLLARSSGVWPHMLRGQRDDRVSLLFTDLTERALPPVVIEPTDRHAEYARAMDAFAARLGYPVASTAAPDALGSARYDRVLDVHAVALAALLDEAAQDATPARRDPLLRVLHHERRYWAAAAVPHELPAPGRLRHDQVVSAATLFTAHSTAEARELFTALPTFDGEGHEVVQRHLRWLDSLYPGPDALNPLRPDRLGEDLVAATLLDQPELVEWVAPVVRESQVTRALTVLGRAGPRYPHVREAMVALLAADPATRLPLAIGVATQLQDTMVVEALREVSGAAAGSGLDLEESVTDHLPAGSLTLAAYSVVVTRAALDAERRKEHPDAETVAQLTHNLSLRLSAVNQHDTALVHAAEAVALYENLAEADEDFSVELGSALNTLACAYSDAGFPEEGFDAAARSCDLLSRVDSSSPEHRQLYATALMNLANVLSDLSRHREAVDAAEHALELTTALHDEATEEDRVECLDRLANAQHNLSTILAGAGLHAGALTAAEESVRAFRDLDASDSDRFRDAYIRALGNLSAAHTELGQVQEAADVTETALPLARDLVERHGDGHLHFLADVLNNGGAALRRLGRLDEAAERLTEAVALYRTLSTRSPSVELPALARALHNLGNCLLESGHSYKAHDVYDESIDIYRKLADPRPDTHEPDLADTLLAQAGVLHDLGEYEEALALTAEAAEILRRLVESGGAVLRRKLAKALHMLAVIHDDMDQAPEAIDCATSAAAHFAELVASAPEDLPDQRGDWATALFDLGRALDGDDRPEHAIEPLTQAAEVLRDLLREADEDTHRDLLGAVLHTHAASLSTLEHHEEALAHIEEAVQVRRGLDQTLPGNCLALCQSLNNLADTLDDLGRRDEALARADEAVELAGTLREEDEGQSLVYALVTRASVRSEDARSAVQDLVRAWHAALTAQDDDLKAVVLEILENLHDRHPDEVGHTWRALTSEPYPLPRP